MTMAQVTPWNPPFGNMFGNVGWEDSIGFNRVVGVPISVWTSFHCFSTGNIVSSETEVLAAS